MCVCVRARACVKKNARTVLSGGAWDRACLVSVGGPDGDQVCVKESRPAAFAKRQLPQNTLGTRLNGAPSITARAAHSDSCHRERSVLKSSPKPRPFLLCGRGMGQGPRHRAFYWFDGAGLALCSPEQESRKLSGRGGSLCALDSSGGCVRFALTADTRAQ